MHLFDDSLLTSLAAFISAWRFVRLCKKCITIKRRRDFLSHRHRTLFYVCCNAGIFPAQTGTHQVTRDQVVSKRSHHLSAIKVNPTVRFNLFDLSSGVPFLEFWKSSHFTEQIVYHLSVGFFTPLSQIILDMSCSHTYSAK